MTADLEAADDGKRISCDDVVRLSSGSDKGRKSGGSEGHKFLLETRVADPQKTYIYTHRYANQAFSSFKKDVFESQQSCL